MSFSRQSWVLVLVAAAGGCRQQTAVLLQIEGDANIPVEADTLTVILAERANVYSREDFPLAGLPQTLSLRPRAGAPAKVGARVLAVAQATGTEVARADAEVDFGSGEDRTVRLVLDRACRNIDCPYGWGCAVGQCATPPCTGSADCDDGRSDDGVEQCVGGLCTSGFLLTVVRAGNGAVTSTPPGIDCSGTASRCAARFPAGAVVGLSATAGAGSSFSGWSGACSGSTSCAVTVNADQTVTATFFRPIVTLWSRALGDVGEDIGYAVAVAATDDIVLAGAFSGSVDFGGGAVTSAGLTDGFLVEYDPTGAPVASRTFGGSGDDAGRAVAIDPTNGVVVAGSFSAFADFGGGMVASAGFDDVFVARYAADRSFGWADAFGGVSIDQARAVALDGMGNLLLTGIYSNTVDFGGGARTSAGGSDVFLLALSPTGAYRWAVGIGGPMDDVGWAIAAGASGDAVAAGEFEGMVDFGGGSTPSAGAWDGFVARYAAADGTYQWSHALGDAFVDSALAVAVDTMGNIVASGRFEGMVDFGSGALRSAGFSDIFVAKYSPTGSPLWSVRAGGSRPDWGQAVAVDGSGNVAVTGAFEGTVDFGSGPLVSAGMSDAFVARYDAAGGFLSAQRFGGAGVDQGRGVATDSMGNVVVTGTFQGTVDFGDGARTAAGMDDVFLVRLAP